MQVCNGFLIGLNHDPPNVPYIDFVCSGNRTRSLGNKTKPLTICTEVMSISIHLVSITLAKTPQVA